MGEDARTSHPCERRAGCCKATCRSWRGKDLCLRGRSGISKAIRAGEGSFDELRSPCVPGVRQIEVVSLEVSIMSERNEIVSGKAQAGNFGECLVEGNAEDEKRGRKIKRRAMALSIALESAALTVLVIAPMLARPAELGIVTTTPIPPYAPRAVRASTAPPDGHHRGVCIVCPRGQIAPLPRSTDPIDTHFTAGPIDDSLIPISDAPEGLRVWVNRNPPRQPSDPPQQKTRISEAHISAALLVQRIEPAYPPLAKQLRRSGRVELHAIIATDGTIQSLEVVSGDPLFLDSALDAVKRWRYRPTLLNGQPVEVDTFITVIYTLNSQ